MNTHCLLKRQFLPSVPVCFPTGRGSETSQSGLWLEEAAETTNGEDSPPAFLGGLDRCQREFFAFKRACWEREKDQREHQRQNVHRKDWEALGR